jgi:hypothetical protein
MQIRSGPSWLWFRRAHDSDGVVRYVAVRRGGASTTRCRPRTTATAEPAGTDQIPVRIYPDGLCIVTICWSVHLSTERYAHYLRK